MKRKLFATLLILGLLIVAFAMSNATVTAKPADTYTIDWYSIDGGAAQDLSGGAYTLSSTVGQFDAGSQSGGAYSLGGGFWSSAQAVADTIKIYLPFIRK